MCFLSHLFTNFYTFPHTSILPYISSLPYTPLHSCTLPLTSCTLPLTFLLYTCTLPLTIPLTLLHTSSHTSHTPHFFTLSQMPSTLPVTLLSTSSHFYTHFSLLHILSLTLYSILSLDSPHTFTLVPHLHPQASSTVQDFGFPPTLAPPLDPFFPPYNPHTNISFFYHLLNVLLPPVPKQNVPGKFAEWFSSYHSSICLRSTFKRTFQKLFISFIPG